MKHIELRTLLSWYFEKRAICGLHSIPIDEDIELSREGKGGVSAGVFTRVCLISVAIASVKLELDEWRHLQQEYMGKRRIRRDIQAAKRGDAKWEKYRKVHARTLCACTWGGGNNHWGALCRIEGALIDAGLLALSKPRPGVPHKNPRVEMVSALKHLQREIGD